MVAAFFFRINSLRADPTVRERLREKVLAELSGIWKRFCVLPIEEVVTMPGRRERGNRQTVQFAVFQRFGGCDTIQ